MSGGEINSYRRGGERGPAGRRTHSKNEPEDPPPAQSRCRPTRSVAVKSDAACKVRQGLHTDPSALALRPERPWKLLLQWRGLALRMLSRGSGHWMLHKPAGRLSLASRRAGTGNLLLSDKTSDWGRRVLLRSQEATLGRGCGASPSRPTCLHCVWLVEVARRGGSSESPESSLLPPAPVPANGWEGVVCVLEPHVPNCSLVSHDLEPAPPGDPSVFASPSHPRRRRPRGNQPHFCPPAAAALPTGGPSGPSAVVMPWTGSVTRRWPVLSSLIAPATAGSREHETSCQLPKVSAPLEAVSRSDY